MTLKFCAKCCHNVLLYSVQSSITVLESLMMLSSSYANSKTWFIWVGYHFHCIINFSDLSECWNFDENLLVGLNNVTLKYLSLAGCDISDRVLKTLRVPTL